MFKQYPITKRSYFYFHRTNLTHMLNRTRARMCGGGEWGKLFENKPDFYFLKRRDSHVNKITLLVVTEVISIIVTTYHCVLPALCQ